jgi:hypothetical protein
MTLRIRPRESENCRNGSRAVMIASLSDLAERHRVIRRDKPQRRRRQRRGEGQIPIKKPVVGR